MSRDIDVPRFLPAETCRILLTGMNTNLRGRNAHLGLWSQWRGDVRWARNRLTVARDWRDNTLNAGSDQINQLDTDSVTALVQRVQSDWREFPQEETLHPRGVAFSLPSDVYPQTHIWSDATYAQTAETRSVIATQLIDGAEQAGMLSAGYISVEARGTALQLDDGRFLYAPQTFAQCSLTVRDPQGTGSGWAGASSYDWGRFDAHALATIALDKCIRSRHPVRIEPGRYTLILEPQATFDLVSLIFRDGMPQFMDRKETEEGQYDMPFRAPGQEMYPVGRSERPVRWARTYLGKQVVDPRIRMFFDPLDPDLGVLPFADYGFPGNADPGDPMEPVTWIKNGTLTTLAYGRQWGREKLHRTMGAPNSGAFRMSGGTTTIDEMIATTPRGLIVTRFWGVREIDQQSILFTGLTRDGLWLIEHGKISHPVTNLRWTESPLFALNQVEQLGVPVPVFSPGLPAIVPPIKVHDFSFTSTIDAV